MCSISSLPAATSADLIKALAARRITAFALEKVPRITRAQSMDVLSSQSTVSGYKAVLIGAAALPKFLPSLTTAAGSIPPARVFVLGAGVAGLQAIATARRLGAIVSAFDVRAAAAEQVMSLGATFVASDLVAADAETKGGYARAQGEEERERTLAAIARHIVNQDLVITTALIPGRAAPVLITKSMVESMQPGSVIVDLAAEAGGNCELTKPNETIRVGGVTIIGAVNLPSTVPYHASQMLSRNILTLLQHLDQGERPHDRPHRRDHQGDGRNSRRSGGMNVTGFMQMYVFILAAFVGYQIITRVPPLLHTPLMSATNAISAISLVGSLVAAGSDRGTVSTVLGFVAVTAATINMVGGFVITDRMLKMFRREVAPARETPKIGPNAAEAVNAATPKAANDTPASGAK